MLNNNASSLLRDEAMDFFELRDRVNSYRSEMDRYFAAGQKAIAEKYAEAVTLMSKAIGLVSLSTLEETQERVTAAENAAQEASNMTAVSSCKNGFNSTG